MEEQKEQDEHEEQKQKDKCGPWEPQEQDERELQKQQDMHESLKQKELDKREVPMQMDGHDRELSRELALAELGCFLVRMKVDSTAILDFLAKKMIKVAEQLDVVCKKVKGPVETVNAFALEEEL